MQNHLITQIQYNNKTVQFHHFKNEHISNIIRKNKKFYESGMLNYIANNKIINKNKTFIDVGANIGNHSVFFSLIAKDVVAFEPVQQNYELLDLNKNANNLNNLTIYKCGLGDKVGIYSANINSKNMGSSTIVESNDGNIEVKLPETFFNSNTNIELIKIDVEDMCLNVIKGFKDIILNNKPHLFVEADVNELKFIEHFLNYKSIAKFNATPTYHLIPK